jgi:hypothetical protein
MNPILERAWTSLATNPVKFARVLMPINPHPGQATWLNKAVEPINVLVPGNRWGKSMIIAVRHIHHNLFKVGLPKMSKKAWKAAPYETMSTAMSADQAEIVYKNAVMLLRHPAVKPLVKAVYSTPFPRIEFLNGSVMHCRSSHDKAKYIDGHQYRFLSVDEAGWIPDLKYLMSNIYVMRLAGGGSIDLIGTPKGYGDLYWYYLRGERGQEGYYSQRGSIFDNPYLSPEDLKMRDRLLTESHPKLREQVLYGAFVDEEGLAFTHDQMSNAFIKEMPEETPPVRGHRYVTAWDLGRNHDFTVGITLDVTTRPWQLVCYERLNKVPWEIIYARIEATRKKYNCRWATIDATGPGGDVIEEEMVKRGIQIDPVKVTTRTIKLDLINKVQSALDEGRQVTEVLDSIDIVTGQPIKVPVFQEPGEGEWGLLRMPYISQLQDEMGIYKLDDADLVQDSVFALALAVNAAYDTEEIAPPVLGGIYQG